MTQLPPDTQEMLDSLRAAVAETLERKRRLGQYAVFWQDGKPVFIGEDAPRYPEDTKGPEGANDHHG
ncbi:hypothetical protein [Halomonas lysinitropha]|uniref:Uncharacterized protein n=1 Tax=Halomonas lysinitropha TaxID=2607506 RepID=A0A5K1I3D0_9GAMM|nr:hypothetical protein [Halomonas lysinitropha]VVZ96144.1 hypothetical protein HALO32_02240 [Halomonas lysinitropha]